MYEKIETSEETARAEQDLTAQQLAAWAAVVAAIAGTVALGVSGLGIWLVWRTLEATRDAVAEASKGTRAALVAAEAAQAANTLAREQYEASFRPFLLITAHDGLVVSTPQNPFKQFSEDEGMRMIPLGIALTLTNIGEMPAIVEAHSVDLVTNSIYIMKAVSHLLRSQEPYHLEVLKGGKVNLNITSELQDSRYAGVQIPIVLAALKLTAQNRNEVMDMAPPPIVGHVIYRDPIGNRRVHGFAFTSRRMWNRGLQRWGGSQYNYDRKLD